MKMKISKYHQINILSKTGSNITYWSMVTFIVFILGSLCLLSAALTKTGKHKVNIVSSI